MGEPNEGKPTMPFDVPVAAHVGRFVDSANTANVQHVGMRTVRAETVRPNPANGRVYVKLGSTIGAYDLDTFFTGQLAEPMVPVSVMVTGSKYGGRTPLEKVARPDGWVYPEAARSGWLTPFVDSTERLHDLDVDDRGFVYYRSSIFGWGIHRDDGRTDGTMLPFVVQVPEPSDGHSQTLFTMKVATLDQFRYYAYVSDSVASRVFDVTEAGAPVEVREATSGVHHARSWAKNEAANHVAVLHGTNFLRIYSYAAILDGSAPLFEHLLPSGRRFDGLAFDEAGNLWIGEWGTTGAGTLWKLSAGGYEKTTFTLPGNQFRSEALHAGAGYVAVTGTELMGTVRRRDLQLLKVVDGTPEPTATGNWFRHYYHAAPSGFAQPRGYTNALTEPFLFAQDGLAYLFYSAYGLGDVFELGAELRPPDVKITSISPMEGPPVGGTVVTVTGRNFGQDAVVSFDGTAAQTTVVSANQLTAVAPAHAAGQATVFVSSNGQVAMGPQFTYRLGAPFNFSATGTSSTNVLLTWTASPGATAYDLYMRNPDGTSFKFATTSSLSFNHGGRAPDSAYAYAIRAVDAAGNESLQTREIATTVQFTDATIAPGMKIRGLHLAQMRIAVNALRIAAGLPVLNWTDSAKVLAQQFTELRSAILQARVGISGLATVSFTDSSLTGVPVKAVHMQELLNAVR